MSESELFTGLFYDFDEGELCPKCGSKRVIVRRDHSKKCLECSHTWRVERE